MSLAGLQVSFLNGHYITELMKPHISASVLDQVLKLTRLQNNSPLSTFVLLTFSSMLQRNPLIVMNLFQSSWKSLALIGQVAVAQEVEQSSTNQDVGGSIPGLHSPHANSKNFPPCTIGV